MPGAEPCEEQGGGDKVIPGDQVAIKECRDRLGEQPATRTSIIHSPSLRYAAHASRHRRDKDGTFPTLPAPAAKPR